MSHRPGNALDLAFVVSMCCAAALLRCVFLLDDVFASGFTRFAGNDAWYQVRVAESAFANFPHVLRYDPYLLYPSGAEVPVAPLLPFAIAAIAKLLRNGDLLAPIAAWLPVLLGAATVIPVWAFARFFWGRGAATLAAALIAFLPGEFFRRSLLGNTDQHVLEVFLSSVVLLLLAMALEREDARLALLAGAALALYLLGWTSGAMLVFIVMSASVVIIASTPGAGTGSIRIFATLFATAALLVVWFSPGDALFCALGAALSAGALAAKRVARRPAAFFGLWLGGAAIAALIAIAVHPAYFQKMLLNLHRWLPRTEGALVSEATPLFQVTAPWELLLREFHAAGPVALAGLAALTIAALRSRSAPQWLLVVWSFAMAAATWRQIRFTYYLAPVVALLCAYVWSRASAAAPSKMAMRVGALVAAMVLVVPNVRAALDTATIIDGPGDPWIHAMTWLRESSPPPFATGDPYLAPPGQLRDQLPSWGVLAWWDYGYWITQIAHRVPTANPTQGGAADTARVLLGAGPPALADARGRGVRYIVLDRGIPIRPRSGTAYVSTTIESVARWAGHSSSRYFARYESDSGPLLLFHPEYFQSLAVHLGVFRGDAVIPRKSTVVTIDPDRNGRRVREVRSFDRYDDAARYAAADPHRRRIVSTDPHATCVPLPTLPVRRVHASRGPDPEVQIFEVSD